MAALLGCEIATAWAPSITSVNAEEESLPVLPLMTRACGAVSASIVSCWLPKESKPDKAARAAPYFSAALSTVGS